MHIRLSRAASGLKMLPDVEESAQEGESPSTLSCDLSPHRRIFKAGDRPNGGFNMSDELNKEQTSDAQQQEVTELTEGQLDEVAGALGSTRGPPTHSRMQMLTRR